MKKVFIVEDDANILYALQAQFSVKGFKVITDSGTGSVEDISGRVRTLKPDFIILDLVLPKADGFKILSRIKSEEQMNTIPVFVFTNMGDKETREKCLALGADYFLVKGVIQINDAVEKIEKIIKNKEKL